MSEGFAPCRTLISAPSFSIGSELSFKAVKLMLRLGKFVFLGSLRSEAPCEPDPSVVIFPNLRKQLNAYILSILRFSKKCISTGFLGKDIRILSHSRSSLSKEILHTPSGMFSFLNP
ncbi:unnamed protein product [Rangifer tarandus platyrhynchus]|uniref:Uncharacterized protein n=2 Tax=Rangifer tarandus platyrhynchus TaxID=3082113 RepID=A0AC59Y1S1_RANTA|nr:unnamed protein product [Rangifer tarandus platyrhynchus]